MTVITVVDRTHFYLRAIAYLMSVGCCGDKVSERHEMKAARTGGGKWTVSRREERGTSNMMTTLATWTQDEQASCNMTRDTNGLYSYMYRQ
ncbi:unnamed protein product [Arctogadus glacialis]